MTTQRLRACTPPEAAHESAGHHDLPDMIMGICMVTGTQVELPLAPLDVLDYAAENGLTSCLRPILTMTRDAFPGCSTALRLEQDAEIESEQHIVIEVDVTGWSVEDMFSARNRWSQEFSRVCPSESSNVFQIRLVQKP